MKVWSLNETIGIPNPVATVGTFDGVHRGHRFILEQLKILAEKHGGESVVVTLWPHPRLVLDKDVQLFRLLHTRDEKIRELDAAGIGHLIVIPFSKQIASLTACDFTREFLVDRLGVKVLLLGYDNRFGRDRKGDPEGLALCAEKNSFTIEQLPEFRSEFGRISSTAIREAIQKGRLKDAADMLGYHYYLSGHIVEGTHIGRELGYPTANIHPEDPYKLIPMNGVYAIRAEILGQLVGGMLNIGFRPTLDSASAVKTIETHLFGVDGDLYDEKIVIHFIKRVREEMRFSGMEALKKQLDKDKEHIQQLLSSMF
jgi:riboflavin kinase/FMN adenylyltransferase